MDKPINICMVGTGRMGHAHTWNLAAIPDVILHSVVGRTEKEAVDFAESTGYKHAGTDLEATLLAPEIDAVIVSTPNPLHGPQTGCALRAGKHVLCELPLAMDLKEAEELALLAQQQGKLAMVCHTERYEPGRLELWRRIRACDLHPLHVIADFYLLRRGACLTAEDRAPWYDNALWHHGCHAVDAVISLLGEAQTLDFHVIHGPATPGVSVPLDWALHWRTPKGVLVSITLSHNAVWHGHEYRVICEEDTLVSGNWGMLRNKDGVIVDRQQGPSSSNLQDQEFITAIRENRPLLPPGVDAAAALQTIRILQAAWETWAQV